LALCVLSVSYHAYEAVELGAVTGPLIALVLDGSLAVGVIYAGYRLGRSDLRPADRWRIARWNLAGAIVGFLTVGATLVVRYGEGRGVAEPAFPLLVATGAGALAGTIAGYYAIRSEATDRQFEAIFNNTYQFTGLLEPDGTVVEVNETLIAFSDNDRDAVVGKKLWEAAWFENNEQVRTAIRRGVEQASNGDMFRDRLRLRASDRDAIVDFSIRPLTDETGEVELLIPEGRDITELHQQREHLDVIHRYFRHNMRNRLTAIGGFATRLADNPDDPDRAEYARRIEENVDSLSSSSELINELADLIDQQETGREQIDLGAAVERARRIMDEDPALIEVSHAETDVEVEANAALELALGQLFETLLEHVEEGGEVQVEVEQREDTATIELRCYDCDIPSTELLAFQSAEERNPMQHPTGISLWFAKSVIENHGGSVEHEDSPAAPTRVQVRI